MEEEINGKSYEVFAHYTALFALVNVSLCFVNNDTQLLRLMLGLGQLISFLISSITLIYSFIKIRPITKVIPYLVVSLLINIVLGTAIVSGILSSFRRAI